MSNTELANRWEKAGMWFQIPMVLLYMVNVVTYAFSKPIPFWVGLVTIPGGVFFGWCLAELYGKRRRKEALISTGPFRYTRHPMYAGLFLMNLVVWLPSPPLTITFFASQALWMALLVTAGWYQEQETLHRFGPEAQWYYDNTPRIPFIWR